MTRFISIFGSLLLAASMAGCAATDPSGQNDPYEHTNRSIFTFDEDVDHAVARPVAVFYNHAVPEVARDGVHNALTNLDSPVIFANDLLQGEVPRAGQTLGRAV